MKKYIILILIIVLIITLMTTTKEKIKIKEERSIFISYIDLSKIIDKTNINNSKKNIKETIKNIKKLKFNMVILQVRSFSDAIYKSNVYPWSSVVSNKEGKYPGFDVLDFFIKEAHKNNIKINAWINPYRVRLNNDINTISTNNPAYRYINTDTLYINNGIYYNPAKEEVIDLITKGVEELINNYDIDKVLFDDYFYPDNNIDIKDYNKYKEKHDITLEQYHLNNVNKLIKRVHNVCKKNNIKFGVSPDGNIENNYTKNYADVRKWCSSTNYIDYIMPQIYYGFYNETKPFKDVLNEWESITTSNIDIIIALAFYKTGKLDEYAKSGSNEWINNSNIIMKEILLSRNIKKYKGYALFRYDNIFNNNYFTSTTLKEIENIKKIT